MQRFLQLFAVLCLSIMVVSAQFTTARGSGGSLNEVLRSQPQLSTFVELVDSAELSTMLSNPGNYTLLAPTNDAFSAEMLATLRSDPNQLRQVLLYHIMQGRFGSGEIQSWGVGSMTTALGNQVATRAGQPLMINYHARVTQTDLESNNGVIHTIDAVLNPNPQPSEPAPKATAAPPANGGNSTPKPPATPATPVPTAIPTATPIPTPTKPAWWVDPQESDGSYISAPNENPAFVDGGVQEYRYGVMADASFCKGMTWVVLQQTGNATRVGADRKTNPYRGDSGCNQRHSLLCLDQDFRGAPSASMYDSWANGGVQATVPIPGTRLHSLEAANGICKNTFGHTYRIAEFHDGNRNGLAGEDAGWSFWAYGNLNLGQRYWVRISDQPANPWNSVNPAPPITLNTWVTQVLWPGGDLAFTGGGHQMPSEALRAVRDKCMGLTMVVHRQMEGMVQVGADRISNPYRGDTDCDMRLPVLCINVGGYPPPPTSSGNNYAAGWSGGEVRLSYPMSGHAINTREKATAACQTFGTGWRMASFHDNALGMAGVHNWTMWSYGGLNVGRRFWVAINDKHANPWNP